MPAMPDAQPIPQPDKSEPKPVTKPSLQDQIEAKKNEIARRALEQKIGLASGTTQETRDDEELRLAAGQEGAAPKQNTEVKSEVGEAGAEAGDQVSTNNGENDSGQAQEGQMVDMSGMPESAKFQVLYAQAQKTTQEDLDRRQEEHPQWKTYAEKRLGHYTEAFQPQVRDAILELSRKGYDIKAAGFDSKDPSIQQIMGDFSFNEKQLAELQKLGVTVERSQGYGEDKILSFKAKEANLDSIKKQYDEIAKIIPRTHKLWKNIKILFGAFFYSLFQTGAGEFKNELSGGQGGQR